MPFDKQIIFVVDDEKVIADTLAAILNCAGFIAVAFDDPCRALVCARGTAPDLLISDVMMPGMTGVDLGILFREISPECGVLLFSGRAPVADLVETIQARGADFEVLPKPMHPSELLVKLHAALLTKMPTARREDGLRTIGVPAISEA